MEVQEESLMKGLLTKRESPIGVEVETKQIGVQR